MHRQVGVEHHAHRARQQAAGRQDADAFVVQADQAVALQGQQFWPEVVEVAAKIDGEGLFDRLEIQLEMADQLLDHCPADAVVVVAQQAALGGQLGVRQAVLIGV